MAVQKHFIAIIPPEPLCGRIAMLKEEVSEKYNNKSALRSPPHITLHLPFEWKKEKEGVLIDTLSQFRFGKAFDIELKDFGFFEPKVVFIDVVKSEPLLLLQKNLVSHVKERLGIFNQANDLRPYHPHVTIAFRDLRKTDFYAMQEEYRHRSFSATFTCDRFALLEHTGKIWSTKSIFACT